MTEEKKPKFTKEAISNNFTANKKLKVVFTKKGGEERTMICTRDHETMPEDYRPKDKGDSDRPGRPTPGHLFSVFDLEKNGWRSFTIDNVMSIEPLV